MMQSKPEKQNVPTGCKLFLGSAYWAHNTTKQVPIFDAPEPMKDQSLGVLQPSRFVKQRSKLERISLHLRFRCSEVRPFILEWLLSHSINFWNFFKQSECQSFLSMPQTIVQCMTPCCMTAVRQRILLPYNRFLDPIKEVVSEFKQANPTEINLSYFST